jgi:hypothetical protein
VITAHYHSTTKGSAGMVGWCAHKAARNYGSISSARTKAPTQTKIPKRRRFKLRCSHHSWHTHQEYRSNAGSNYDARTTRPAHTYEKLFTLGLPHYELSLMMIGTHPIRPLWGIMHAQPGGSNHTNAYTRRSARRRSIHSLPDHDDS